MIEAAVKESQNEDMHVASEGHASFRRQATLPDLRQVDS